MGALYYVHLEAETGKVYVKPFYSLESLVESAGIRSTRIQNAALLPEPFRFCSDSYAQSDGKGINFLASFYCGLHYKRVLCGDVFIVKSIPCGITGLTSEEVSYFSLDLERSFGIRLPAFSA